MTPAPSTDPAVIPLWNETAPHQAGTGPNDIPSLTLFLPAQATSSTPAIVLFPGGGYEMLAFEHEGINEAKWFQERSVAAFVLKYRLPSHGYRHPVPLLDAQRALRLVRCRAAEWKIQPDKIGIMGFSAGGHLASTLETHFDAGDSQATDPVDRLSCRPDFAALIYPVISLKGGIAHQGSMQNLLGPQPDPALIDDLSNQDRVTAQTPPTILVHPEDDSVVPIANSDVMFAALQKAGVPAAFLRYPKGEHGFGYGPNNYNNNGPTDWLARVHNWLKEQGFMS